MPRRVRAVLAAGCIVCCSVVGFSLRQGANLQKWNVSISKRQIVEHMFLNTSVILVWNITHLKVILLHKASPKQGKPATCLTHPAIQCTTIILTIAYNITSPSFLATNHAEYTSDSIQQLHIHTDKTVLWYSFRKYFLFCNSANKIIFHLRSEHWVQYQILTVQITCLRTQPSVCNYKRN